MTAKGSRPATNPWIRAGLTAAAIVVFGYTLIVAGRSRIPASAEQWGAMGSEVPETAPAFSLADREGTLHSLDELRGRPIVLNFWASWCPPCLDEMPALQTLAETLSDTDVAVVAVTLDDTWAEADAALSKTRFGDGVLLLKDSDRLVAASYGTFKVPETYLIARDGHIVHRFQGAKEWDQPGFLADLRSFVEQD